MIHFYSCNGVFLYILAWQKVSYIHTFSHFCAYRFCSHSHLASLRPIQQIQAHTLCFTGIVPTYCRALYSGGYIFMESTLGDLRQISILIEFFAS
jgi:hypothetical protein